MQWRTFQMTEKENVASEGNINTHKALLTQKTQAPAGLDESDRSEVVDIQIDKPEKGEDGGLAYIEQDKNIEIRSAFPAEEVSRDQKPTSA